MSATLRKSQSLEVLLGPPKAANIVSMTAKLRQLDGDLWLHAGLVAEAATEMAREMDLSNEARDRLIDAAWLHDLGKLTIARDILDKPAALDASEWSEMQSHATRGADFLAVSPRYRAIGPMVRHHHERFDGTGYPDRLPGTQIPIEARIICVIDAFDAMITERPYRSAMSFGSALVEVRRCAGTQFDPEIAETFFAIAGKLQGGAFA